MFEFTLVVSFGEKRCGVFGDFADVMSLESIDVAPVPWVCREAREGLVWPEVELLPLVDPGGHVLGRFRCCSRSCAAPGRFSMKSSNNCFPHF